MLTAISFDPPLGRLYLYGAVNVVNIVRMITILHGKHGHPSCMLSDMAR